MKPLYWFCYTLSGIIAKTVFSYHAFGRENIIEDGPAIMAANHQSYLDPPLVGITCREELYFLARKTLFEKKLLGPLISRVNALPVDLSRGDLTAVRTIINLLKDGHRTVIFPEGTRSLDGNIQPARPGIGMIIAKTLVPVVPILAIVACLWLMLNLTALTWVRFVVWMVLGLVMYFAYGARHSILGHRHPEVGESSLAVGT